MKKMFLWWFAQFGLHPIPMLNAFKALPRFFRDYLRFRQGNTGWKTIRLMPCLHDRGDAGGTASGHYFHQDLYVAKRIYERKPEKHVDIGSRIDGFVAHVASFREIEICDIRPVDVENIGITCHQFDVMQTCPRDLVEYADSLSCLHALEHFGLGRYGDEINPDGYIVGLRNILDILQPNGYFYLSVPMGYERVEFNAHRVFSVKTVLDICSLLKLVEFAWVDDDGKLHKETDLSRVVSEDCFSQTYGLAIFTFIKARD